MTVGSLLEGGFRLIRERGGALLIWTLIQLVVTVATGFAMATLLRNSVDAVASGVSPDSAQLSYALLIFLLGLAGLLVSTILYAAAQRAVLRPDEGGPGWLKLGMDEVRLFLLVLLYTVLFSLAFGILGAIMGAFTETGGTMLTIFSVLTIIAAAGLGTKVSLTFPLTLKRKAFAVTDGVNLTKGHFWTLFLAYVVIALGITVFSVLIMVITQPEYISAIAEHGFLSAEAEQASLVHYERLMAGTVDAPIIINWALTAIQGAMTYALYGGAAATAVQHLDGAEEGLSETFS